MKKLFIIPIIILLTSCGYYKDSQVSHGVYMIRIWQHTFTNMGAQKIYYLPMEGITDKKVDSINRLADKYIENCEKYTKR